MTEPILLYCSDVWGFNHLKLIKQQLKSTCDVNLLSKLSIIFREWRVVNNMYRGGARV
jgi:hypothetical protein